MIAEPGIDSVVYERGLPFGGLLEVAAMGNRHVGSNPTLSAKRRFARLWSGPVSGVARPLPRLARLPRSPPAFAHAGQAEA